MSTYTFEKIADFCKQNNRICPQPQLWNNLWQKLNNKKQVGAGWQPSLPLILAAWWDTPPFSKQLRLMEHLRWAEANNQLQEIGQFLYNLREEDWFHLND